MVTTSNRQCKATPQRLLFSVPPGTYCGHDVKPAVQKDASSLVVFCTSRYILWPRCQTGSAKRRLIPRCFLYLPVHTVATMSNRQCKKTPHPSLFSVPPGRPGILQCWTHTLPASLSGTFFQRCRKRTLGVGGQHWQDVASPWSLENLLPAVRGPQDPLPTGPVMGHVRGDYTSPRNLSYHDCISSQNMCYDDCI